MLILETYLTILIKTKNIKSSKQKITKHILSIMCLLKVLEKIIRAIIAAVRTYTGILSIAYEYNNDNKFIVNRYIFK